jgi:hypothetical protein
MVVQHHGECRDGSEHLLLRHDTRTGEARGFKFAGSPLLDEQVATLRLAGDVLWIAGGRFIHRVDLVTETFRRFRIVNFARLASSPVAVFDRTRDGAPRAMLARRIVEALWECPGWLEVATEDCVVAAKPHGPEWGAQPAWFSSSKYGALLAFAGARVETLRRLDRYTQPVCVHAGWVRDEGAVVVPEVRELAPWSPATRAR